MRACAHQPEVKAMLLQGHWPHACDPDLRNHIHVCSRCKSQVLLAAAFQSDRARTIQAAPIQHPSLIWWRAQLRRREQALLRVGRSTSTAHFFALAVTIAAAATLLIRQSTSSDWLPWLSAPYTALHLDAVSIFTSARTSLTADLDSALIATAAGTLLVLAAVVAYLASDHQ